MADDTDNVFQRIHRNAASRTRERAAVARAMAHRWQDPLSFLYEDDIKYKRTGGINISDTMDIASDIFFAMSGHVTENQAILVMFQKALWATEKIIYLEAATITSTPEADDTALRLAIGQYPRNCAVCGLKTSSGVRALCDDCHKRFIVDANFNNTPLTYNEVAEAIWRSDTRHRAIVKQKLHAA